MSSRLGVCIVGSSGAVATTVIAGVELIEKLIQPRLVDAGPESARVRDHDETLARRNALLRL